MLNEVAIMGRLCADPELRTTGGGTHVCTITLAVERDLENQDGTRTTDFINVVAWKNRAEFLAKCFKKGSRVIVTGRLEVRDWTDKEGNKRKAVEVLARNVYFGDSKKNDNPQASSTSFPKEPGAFVPVDNEEDELPF